MAIIRNEALHKQVAAAMRQSIATGEWPPGTQLPTETDLAQFQHRLVPRRHRRMGAGQASDRRVAAGTAAGAIGE